ncbi:oxidation resistance protein 1 [Onygenales sp. PD_40]|nr:oxidation resistance protein 1 [Onygenales sp. PD_40]KAK2796174.1 oxidation resistance protein 1 [Onygenales sp. PD_12]KAK2804046.1 oxidation resistance protein 1 [Onygenales sp. PD_10]
MPSNEASGSIASNTTPHRVLVIGGSYAGLSAALNLLDLCQGKNCRFTGNSSTPSGSKETIPIQITIVDERDGYLHLIGAPLAFACEKYAAKCWRKFSDIPALQTPAVKHIQGTVTSVDCERKVSIIKEAGTNKEIVQKYDYLIASSGLRRNWPSAPQSLQKEDFLLEGTKHLAKTKSAEDGVVIIGGGAVGIEMAAELKHMQPGLKVTLIHSRDKLLSSEPLPDEFRDRALELLHDAGVETIMGHRVTETSPAESSKELPVGGYTITLADGSTVKAGYVINAISKYSPTTSYLPSAVLDKEGYVRINASLNFPDEVPNAQYHYAAGDVALWSGIKRGGRAMHHGHYAAMNIHQTMLKERRGTTPKFVELQEAPPSMGLAVGKQAVAYSPFEGVISGEDTLKLYFGDDLGFSICWNYMQLGSPADKL